MDSSVHDSVLYFIHQMAIHSATKLLPLKADPNRNTNPNWHSNRNIFKRTSLTPIRRFYRIYEWNFSQRCVAGFVGEAIFYTTQLVHYPFADVAVLSSENTSDKKSIVHTLSLRGFCGV